MNELICIRTNQKQEPVVSARELYKYLELADGQFSRWAKHNITDNTFAVDGEDWAGVDICVEGNVVMDYSLSVPFAKKLSMISKTPRGEAIRNYFIRVESEFNSPAKVMARALIMADMEIKSLTAKIEDQKPMVTFAETCLTSKDSILVRELAKIATKQGFNIGEKRLWQKLREWGLILQGNREPSQKAMNNEWFEVKERPVETAYNTLLTQTTMVTPRGQVYIIERLRKEQAN